MITRAAGALRKLEQIKYRHDPQVGERRLRLLKILGRSQLATSAQVLRLHELLCFCRAYPDTPQVLAETVRLLEAFERRRDLRRHRRALLNSGIAGTDIVYSFARLTARWLAGRWGDQLSIEWDDVDDLDRLTRTLILLALPAEVPGLDEAPLDVRAWLTRLRLPSTTDAAYVVRRASAFPVDDWTRDRLYEELRIPCRLATGSGIPSRTLARFETPVTFQMQALRRDRPDLRAEARRPPVSITPVPRRDAERLIDLARGAMVTRERDLDAFVWADARDVRMIDGGDGLQFACIGVLPERRFLLESVYGLLTLQNGVPIGYALASGLLQFTEIAYNVFETFRGGEAAYVFGRLLATARALFASEVFTIPPYQLGDGNDEGLQSGAWWFYYKLGFRPQARGALSLVRREVARVQRDASYRTPTETLERIVPFPMLLSLGRRARRDPIEALRLDRIGLAVTREITSRFGTDRERAARVCADEAASLVGLPDWRRLPPGERTAWKRWSPLVAVLPGVRAWTAAERRALAVVIRAKGGLRESEFVQFFDAHTKLRTAVVALSRGQRPDLAMRSR